MRFIIILFTLAITGCSSFNFPGVHKIAIQQGNVITQTMVDKLKPGMTKSQVRFILGNAIINDSLNQERWDYLYSVQFGGQSLAKKHMSLFFIEDKLDHFEGDYIPSAQQQENSGV